MRNLKDCRTGGCNMRQKLTLPQNLIAIMKKPYLSFTYNKNIILRKMPQLQNVSIWCRNGEFCHKATHCERVSCDYKKFPNDVTKGCSKCQAFQITTKSEIWESAYHLFDYGKVINLKPYR